MAQGGLWAHTLIHTHTHTHTQVIQIAILRPLYKGPTFILYGDDQAKLHNFPERKLQHVRASADFPVTELHVAIIAVVNRSGIGLKAMESRT